MLDKHGTPRKTHRTPPRKQDFFLDLIFAPVETSTSSSKPAAEGDGGSETESATASTSAAGASETTPEDSAADPEAAAAAAAAAAATPGESTATKPGGGDGGATGAEAAAGAETENSAVARRELLGSVSAWFWFVGGRARVGFLSRAIYQAYGERARFALASVRFRPLEDMQYMLGGFS